MNIIEDHLRRHHVPVCFSDVRIVKQGSAAEDDSTICLWRMRAQARAIILCSLVSAHDKCLYRFIRDHVIPYPTHLSPLAILK